MPASAAPAGVTALQHAGTAHTATPAAAARGWTGPVHHVEAGDTLWDLAEHYLGSGTRWHEIADLNTGVRQADGTVLTGNVLELQSRPK